MKQILIVGSGGREHALTWKLKQSSKIERIYVAPGNGGTQIIAQNVDIAETDLDGISQFVADRKIDLTVVGPELPLSVGLVNRLSRSGFRAFGPSRQAARLETSKIFAKEFMTRHNIPTAPYRVAAEFNEALNMVREIGLPVAIKADGLAAGKGVVVCHDFAEAKAALASMIVEEKFGPAGRSVVVEAGLSGEEISLLAFCDGYTAVPMLIAQDHKAVYDGDQGPNTGGMGSFAPVSHLAPDVVGNILKTIVQPTVDGMRAEGNPFRGILYTGLMLTGEGPRVLEYNVRFGDPETQATLPLLKTDLLDILGACMEGSLAQTPIEWLPGACVCVVCASRGYPGPYEKGFPIRGITDAEQVPGVTVFHAGTHRDGNEWVTAGGRVLGVTCRARDLPAAIEGAYQATARISFEGMHYRKDIGAKGLRHLS